MNGNKLQFAPDPLGFNAPCDCTECRLRVAVAGALGLPVEKIAKVAVLLAPMSPDSLAQAIAGAGPKIAMQPPAHFPKSAITAYDVGGEERERQRAQQRRAPSDHELAAALGLPAWLTTGVEFSGRCFGWCVALFVCLFLRPRWWQRRRRLKVVHQE